MRRAFRARLRREAVGLIALYNGRRDLQNQPVAEVIDKPGRIFASVHERAIYVSDDDGRNWRKDGLEGSSVFRMKFVPERSK